MVVVVVVELACFGLVERVGAPEAVRFPAVGFGGRALFGVFADKAFVGVAVVGTAVGEAFLDASAEGVVAVCGDSAIGQVDLA